MSKQNKSPTTLLVSVGGSPEPIIHSIEQHRPEQVIYFCSRDSRKQIREHIEPRLKHPLRDSAVITTPDEQSLLASVQELVRELPRRLVDMGADFAGLQADFTGGTKAMSAAVVLALADRGCSYSYVGGVSRDKQGLGVVLNGREQLLYSDNPWDALGREPLMLFALHFNRCRFSSAHDTVQTAAERSNKLKPLFDTLARLAEGYGHWDNFNHQTAKNLLSRCIEPLKTLPCMDDGQNLTTLFAARLEADITRLDSIKNDMLTLEGKKVRERTDGSALLLDLLANAVRRAEREHKYEDAVARLYSAVEKAGKIRLHTVHGIDNSKVEMAQVPEARRTAVLGGLSAEDTGRFKLPLYRSYALLDALGDDLGKLYRQREKDLRKVLDIRNHSLLAHGFNAVSAETYGKLLEIALDFCGVDRDALPDFPRLPET